MAGAKAQNLPTKCSVFGAVPFPWLIWVLGDTCGRLLLPCATAELVWCSLRLLFLDFGMTLRCTSPIAPRTCFV